MGGCYVSQGENCFEREHNINVKIIPLCDLFGTHGGVGIRAFCAFVAVCLWLHGERRALQLPSASRPTHHAC